MTTRIVKYSGGWTNYIHLGCSICASQSEDGDRVASSATHGQCLIRDAQTDDILVRLNGHWNSVGWIAWEPEDKTVASACSDGTARIWNPRSGKEIFRLSHPTTVTCVAYLPGGNEILTACWDGSVRRWDLNTGRKLQEISLGSNPVGVVAASHLGGLVVAVCDPPEQGEAGRVVLLREGQVVSEVELPLPETYRVRWSPIAAKVALTGRDGVLIFEATENGLERKRLLTSVPRSLSLDWNPEGDYLCLGTEAGELCLVPLEEEREAHRFQAHSDLIWTVEWHPRKQQLISVSADGSIGLWRPRDFSLLLRMARFSRGISAVDWSPDEKTLTSSSAEGNFCLWDVPHRKAIGEFGAHQNWIRAIRWHDSGERFLTASQDGSIAVWRSDGQPVVNRLPLNIGSLWAALWAEDDRIAAISETGHFCLVDPYEPGSQRAIKLGDEWLRGLSLSNDRSQVAVGSMSGMVRVISTSDMSVHWNINLNVPCFDCAFSPRGRFLALALGDGSVRLAEVGKSETSFTFAGHSDQAWSVAFSQDGLSLVTAGADGTVRVWSLEQAEPIRIFRLPTSCIAARFSRSGQIVFGSAGAWTLDPFKSEDVPGEYSKTLTDSPVALLDGPASEDLLGRAPLVEELAFFLHRSSEYARERIHEGEAPDGFLVHIGGRWGSGKTSLATDLANRVATKGSSHTTEGSPLRHWESVYFKAWGAVGLGPAWWSMAMAIRSHYVAQRGVFGRLLLRLREINFQFPHLIRQLVLLTILLGLVLTITTNHGRAWIERAGLAARSLFTSGEPKLITGISILADIVTLVLPTLTALAFAIGLYRYARRRWRWPQLDSREISLDTEWHFNSLPREYLRWLRSQCAPDLLLIIDDLDRCPPDYVAETLSAIHTMARSDYLPSRQPLRGNVSAFAVLILAERHWLEMAAEAQIREYRQQPNKSAKTTGAEFLEKVFIASVELPRLNVSQRQIMVRESLAPSRTLGTRRSGEALESFEGETEAERDAPASTTVRELAALRERIATLEQADAGAVESIVRTLTSLDPANRERMHVLLARRMNRPEYRAAEEAQLLDDYASLMDSTPRGVKRTLVNFWLNRVLAQVVASDRTLSDEAIMRWTILSLRWPAILDEFTIGKEEEWLEYAKIWLGAEFDEFREVIVGLDIGLAQRMLRA